MPITLDNQDSCSPDPGTHGRTVTTVQPPLCRGRYEGPDPFLGRRGSPPGPAAIAASMAPAPPYVCGAGTRRLHLRVDMKSAHASECRHRQHKKVEKIPLTGVVCLLTTGGLIRVRRGGPLRSTTAELIRGKRHKFPDAPRRPAGHSLHAVRQSVVPTSPVQFAHRQDMTGEVLRHSKPFQLAFEILGGNVRVSDLT